MASAFSCLNTEVGLQITSQILFILKYCDIYEKLIMQTIIKYLTNDNLPLSLTLNLILLVFIVTVLESSLKLKLAS